MLITAATRDRLDAEVPLERRGERVLRGLERPIELFALAGASGDGSPGPVDAVRAVYARVRGDRGEG